MGAKAMTIIAGSVQLFHVASERMKVQLVDPSAFTPPYDRALAAALARAGAEVELLTSRFLHGPLPPAEGYRVEERFYRRAAARGLDAPGRLPFKAAEHVPDMLRLRGALDADVVHYQWLTIPALDVAPAAAAAAACDDRALHPAAEPEPPAGRAARGASSARWTPSSPTPSTAPRGCATRSGSIRAGSASSPTAPSTT